MKRDSYIDEIQEEVGRLFEMVVKEGYDLVTFTEGWLSCFEREAMDKREPYHCTRMFHEHFEEQMKKHPEFFVKTDKYYDPWLAMWVGEYYCALEMAFKLPSFLLLNTFPVKDTYIRSHGLHDHDIEPLVNNLPKPDRGLVVFFHSPKEEYGFLSNWYKSDFEIDGITFNCVEKYMMYGKAKFFEDDEIAQKILQTNDPREIKALGRQVKNFNEGKWKWNREDIVYKGCVAKFTQNESLLKQLKPLKNKIFAEASKSDTIWGIGCGMNSDLKYKTDNWSGLNLLGATLMRVCKYLFNIQPIGNYGGIWYKLPENK